jgi:hypothetical protein
MVQDDGAADLAEGAELLALLEVESASRERLAAWPTSRLLRRGRVIVEAQSLSTLAQRNLAQGQEWGLQKEMGDIVEDVPL